MRVKVCLDLVQIDMLGVSKTQSTTQSMPSNQTAEEGKNGSLTSSSAQDHSSRNKASGSKGSGPPSSERSTFAVKHLHRQVHSMQSEIDEMGIEQVIEGESAAGQDGAEHELSNQDDTPSGHFEPSPNPPLPSPRNVFTNDIEYGSNPSPTPASGGHQIISLKMLDSDDPSSSGPTIKPESSKRVSFSRRVKMKEVGRYISLSSPSQRPPKPPKSGYGPSKLSSSITPSSTKRKRSDYPSSAPSSQSLKSASNSYTSLSRSNSSSFSGKSISLGSMYLADSKAALAAAFPTSNGKARQSGAATTRSSYNTRSAGVLNSSDGYLISSEGDRQSQIQSTANLESKSRARGNSSILSSIKPVCPVFSAKTGPLRQWTVAANNNSSTSKKRREIAVSMAFLWEKVRLYESGTENSKSINVKKSKFFFFFFSVMISEKCSIPTNAHDTSATTTSFVNCCEENVQLLLCKNQILTVQHAPSHNCYPYSFLKIMLKDGVEYLVAVIGAANLLVAALQSIGLSIKDLPYEAYAKALALVESANAIAHTGNGNSSNRPHSVNSHIPSSSPSHPMFLMNGISAATQDSTAVQQFTTTLPNNSPRPLLATSSTAADSSAAGGAATSSFIPGSAVLPVALPNPLSLIPYDNKVLYLWEQEHESNQLKAIGLHHARISLIGQVLEIVDDSCLYISIQVKHIQDMLHDHHSYILPPDETTITSESQLSYSMVKITTTRESEAENVDDSKRSNVGCSQKSIDYLIGVEGSMLPLLKKLGMLGVSCLSFRREESNKMKALVKERRDCESPSKIVGGILKK